MATPPKTSYLDSAYQQPSFNPQRKENEALIRWLLDVKEIAPYANEEGWSDFATLASAIPLSAYDSPDTTEIVEIVKKVAATKKFYKELNAKVDSTLFQRNFQKT
jgi:hypothetical protein